MQVKNVKITDVALPRELSSLLEQTTTFRSRIAEIAKKHENSIRVLQDEASQALESIERTNARRKQDLLAQVTPTLTRTLALTPTPALAPPSPAPSPCAVPQVRDRTQRDHRRDGRPISRQ